MNVKVRSIGLIRQVLGGADLDVVIPEGTNIPGLLNLLARENGEKFAPFAVRADEATSYAPVRILVNGRDVGPAQRTSLLLKEGDDVLIFLPIAGG